MAHNLPPLPRCRKCGNNIVGNNTGDLCRACMLQELQSSYAQADTAEHKLTVDKLKYQRFSSFSVVTFAIVLVLLILVVGAIYYF